MSFVVWREPPTTAAMNLTKMTLTLPDFIVDAVDNARSPCWYYNNPPQGYGRAGCRNGNRCKYRHGNQNDLLPYVSCYVDVSGRVQLNVRPPLHIALEMRLGKLDHSVLMTSCAVGDLMHYPLHGMERQNVVACHNGAINPPLIPSSLGEPKWIGPSGSERTLCPKYILHGTDVASALKIIKCRRVHDSINTTITLSLIHI